MVTEVEVGMGLLGARVMGGFELLEMCPGNQTQVFCKSRKLSQQLSHPSLQPLMGSLG